MWARKVKLIAVELGNTLQVLMKNIMTINKCVLDENCELWDSALVTAACWCLEKLWKYFQALLGL